MTQTVRRLALRGAALAVLHRREPEVLICGPAGTGKSFACLVKVHLMCLQNPGMKVLLVRKTHVSLTATGLATFRDHVIPEAQRTKAQIDVVTQRICDAGTDQLYGTTGEIPRVPVEQWQQ